MDDTTRRLWREADEATAAEVRAEFSEKPSHEVFLAIRATRRAWRALMQWRKQMHRKNMEREAGDV